MKVKSHQYILSEQTMQSVKNQTAEKGEFDLDRIKNSKKGNTIVIIDAETSIMSFMTPIYFKNNFYASAIPSPTSLFFEQAIEYERNMQKVLDTFPKNIVQILGEGTKTEIRLVDQDIYNHFLIYKISAITALITTVESFVNYIIPESYKMENAKKQTIGKQDIERRLDLKIKLLEVVPKLKAITNLETYKLKVNKFVELSKLRNEIIHLKTKLKNNNADPFIDHFESLINLDLKEKINEVKDLINIIQPAYIK